MRTPPPTRPDQALPDKRPPEEALGERDQRCRAARAPPRAPTTAPPRIPPPRKPGLSCPSAYPIAAPNPAPIELLRIASPIGTERISVQARRGPMINP